MYKGKNLEIVFLGTSAGLPTSNRNVSATAIKRGDSKRWYLVDCGDGTQQQILRSKLSIAKLEAILITHVHGDHCFGLAGVLASTAMGGRSNPLTIVAPAAIQDLLQALITTTQMRLGYEIIFIAAESLPKLSLTDFDVEVHPLSHRVESYAYSFTESHLKPKLNGEKLVNNGIAAGPIWHQLQEGRDVSLENGIVLFARDYLLAPPKARRIIIAGDNDSPDLLASACHATQVLVHESTYTAQTARNIDFQHGHTTADSIAKFADRVGLPNLVLTHFSPRYGEGNKDALSIQEIENEARQHYRGNLFLANDFDIFELNRDGELNIVETMEFAVP